MCRLAPHHSESQDTQDADCQDRRDDRDPTDWTDLAGLAYTAILVFPPASARAGIVASYLFPTGHLTPTKCAWLFPEGIPHREGRQFWPPAPLAPVCLALIPFRLRDGKSDDARGALDERLPREGIPHREGRQFWPPAPLAPVCLALIPFRLRDGKSDDARGALDERISLAHRVHHTSTDEAVHAIQEPLQHIERSLHIPGRESSIGPCKRQRQTTILGGCSTTRPGRAVRPRQ